MPKLKQKLFLLFHGFVLVYAVILITMSTAAYAQTWQTDDINRRLSNLENIRIDSRLSVIEASLADIKIKVEKGLLDYVQSGGIGLVLLRFVYSAAMGNKKGKLNDTADF